jgi:hypothetical protein
MTLQGSDVEAVIHFAGLKVEWWWWLPERFT